MPLDTAMRLVNIIAGQIREGQVLSPDERRGGVINEYPVVIRPVHPSWYDGLFCAGLDCTRQPPWPMVQAFWPDKSGRFPWEEGYDEAARVHQPLLWMPRTDHPAGPWTEEDPSAWPFHPTLPYHRVLTTMAVLDGAPVDSVGRDLDGTWHFLDARAPGTGDVKAPLGRVVARHGDVAEVAGLQPGTWVVRRLDGSWPLGSPDN